MSLQPPKQVNHYPFATIATTASINTTAEQRTSSYTIARLAPSTTVPIVMFTVQILKQKLNNTVAHKSQTKAIGDVFPCIYLLDINALKTTNAQIPTTV